jgi:hypothetical protein
MNRQIVLEEKIPGRGVASVQVIHNKKLKRDIYFLYISTAVVRALDIKKHEKWEMTGMHQGNEDYIVCRRLKRGED